MADHPGGHLKKGSSDEEPMQMDMGDSAHIPEPEENPLYTAEPLTLNDLKLLSDLFYLPYEHGRTARKMLQELDWLKKHSAAASADTEEAAAWHSRALCFDDMCEVVVQMFNHLSNAPNRSVLYDLYNYICDIKRGVCLARAYVKILGGHDHPSAQLMTNEMESWTTRGGLSGEFQRMLPGHGDGDLFRHPPRTQVYCIRPYGPEDQIQLERIFREMSAESGAASVGQLPLLCRGLLTGELCPSPESALVLEDDAGLCGYALAVIDAKQAAAKTQRALSPSVLEEFPSLVTMQVLPRVTDSSPAKRMMWQLLSSIRTTGSKGAFCELRQSDQRMLDFYTKLGYFNSVSVTEDIVVMGTSLQK
eukprot:XP_011616567.1 PREDICTED: protein O-GlcNAcase-like isoform X2 [Takifugu rubripes]